MSKRFAVRSSLVALALIFGSVAMAEEKEKPVIINTGRGGGAAPGMSLGFWGGQGGMQYETFNYTLMQMNMTPELTLSAETKQKLSAVTEEWRAAQAKYMADNREKLQQVSKEQMEAYQSKDQEKITAATKKQQELYAGGPKSEEFIAKAKAVLPADQREMVEKKLKVEQEQREAMMKKWKEQESKEGGERRGGGAQIEANPKPKP